MDEQQPTERLDGSIQGVISHSLAIDQIGAALALAQGKIRDAYKSEKGDRYNYANLASILEIARPALSEQGISIVQAPFDASGNVESVTTPATKTQREKGEVPKDTVYLGRVGVCTLLLHASGQYLSSKYTMPIELHPGWTAAQSQGSIVTYLRRYALAAMIGMAQHDNDASLGVTFQDVEYLRDLIGKVGDSEERILQQCGVAALSDMTAKKFDDVLKVLVDRYEVQKKTQAATAANAESLKQRGPKM